MKKSLLVFLGVSLFLLGACGSSNNNSSSSSDSETDKLTQIKEDGVIKVATSPDYAPFGFHTEIDGKDQIVGADIDLMEAIADKMNVKVEWMDMSFNNVLAATKQGKADVAISAISVTDEREKSFDFTDNYYTSPQAVVIRKADADKFTGTDSFEGKQVGAQKGTIQENVVKEQLTGSTLVSIEKLPNIFVELKNGSLDGLVTEKTVAQSYVDQNDDLMIADITLESMKEDSFSIAVPKGNEKLVAQLNKYIKELQDDGSIDKFVTESQELAKNATEE